MALQTSPDHPAPVRQIATLLGSYIDRLGAVWVEGQIAQLNRRDGVSTVFVTLRDSLGPMSMRLTCNRAVIDASDPPVVEGAGVVVHGKLQYYPPNGTLSLVADEIRMVGRGELLARLEQRRQLLAAEGLFARERKKSLPFLPQVVGLVTAPSSAAQRDVQDNARRRWPGVQVRMGAASMQGPNSAREVIEALGRLDRDAEVDVIVIARGGGSVEELLPFSDEGLVRAVAAANTPVVSAIGHEQDVPLLDLVADVRASTPTDAAKLVVPDVAEERLLVERGRARARQLLAARIDQERQQLLALRARPVLAQPQRLVEHRIDEVRELLLRARGTTRQRLERAGEDITHARARVRALSPRETLRRGYAVLQEPGGAVVTTTRGAPAPGGALSARVSDGRLELRVEGTHPDEQLDVQTTTEERDDD